MQCDLLTSSFKNPKTIALMKENIGHISDGTSPHCAIALKLGFKKAFDVKKRERGVLLRCPNYRCGWYGGTISYSSVGSEAFCPSCSNYRSKYYLECVGCGYSRSGSYTSCQSCGKRFI